MTAVTNDGRTIVGVPMNEDTFTVQLMDMSERVHSLDKKSLKSFRHEDRSLMPAYDAARLNDDAISTTSSPTCSRCAISVGSEERRRVR